jgi:uncharacterized protein YgiM (DUF1202 family)
MVFPLVPVLITAATGTLGYLLFKPDAAPANSGAGTLGETTKPSTPLPPAKRPQDLPKPAPAPAPFPSNNLPIPIPNNLPIPIPNVTPPSPSPAPAPIPQPLPIPIPTPVTPTDQTGVVIAPSGVNLRNAPSTSGTVLTGMIAGTRVKILNYLPTATSGAPKGWYQVTAPNGMTGYATAEFINPDNGTNPNPVPIPIPIPVPNVVPNNIPIPPIPTPSGMLQGRILGSPGANMRSSPSTSGAIVKGLFNGTIVNVLSTALAPASTGAPKGWVNVKDSTGASGWVSREFCEPLLPGTFGGDHVFGQERRKRTNLRG